MADINFNDQRAISDVVTFPFTCSMDPMAPAADIVQFGEAESNINDNDLVYDAFFAQYIDVDHDNDQFVVNNNNVCGDHQSQVVEKNVDLVDTDDQKKEELRIDQKRAQQYCFDDHDRHGANDSSVAGSVKFVEAKKSMSADKLAELWILDPKRAKRIMANRQSAARSKQRKARYVTELERKVHSLRTEATALATHLNVYKKDAEDLSTENKELKLRLQTMEHQARLQDDITEAMIREVERLRYRTGEIVPSSLSKLNMQQQQPQFHEMQQRLPPTPADVSADGLHSSHTLPPRLSCQPIITHYWP